MKSAYCTELMDSWLSQAGISPTIRPGIPFLPCCTLTQPEYSHDMFNHIFTRLCQCVLNTNPSYNSNNQTHQVINKIFDTVCRSLYRPSCCSISRLRHTSDRSIGSQKSIHIYRSAFELSVHGLVLGFDSFAVATLQRLIEWNGKFLSDTWDDQMIDWLTSECHSIAILLSESQVMSEFNSNTPCLKTWINLMDIGVYWCQNANVFVGLKFESGNKIRKNLSQYYHSMPADAMIASLTTRNRLVKDIFAQAIGCSVENGLGSGIQKVIQNTHKSTNPLKKLLMYDCQIDGNQIQFNGKSNYDNCNILHSKCKPMSQRGWINLCNWFCHIGHLSVEGVQAKTMLNWLSQTAHYLFVNESICQLIPQMLVSLKNGELFVSSLNGIKTFYRCWSDSVVKKNDSIWFVTNDNNFGLSKVVQMYKIDGLDKFAEQYGFQLKPNWDDSWSCLIIAICRQWHLKNQSLHGFNFEMYDMHSNPLIEISNQIEVVNVKNIIQQVYIAHDHVIPCQMDQIGVSKIVHQWPIGNDSNWASQRNVNLTNVVHASEIEYCGVGWRCRKHNIVDCPDCINDVAVAGGELIYDCKQSHWPYFRAFTIYQGYVNRFFNSVTINELGW